MTGHNVPPPPSCRSAPHTPVSKVDYAIKHDAGCSLESVFYDHSLASSYKSFFLSRFLFLYRDVLINNIHTKLRDGFCHFSLVFLIDQKVKQLEKKLKDPMKLKQDCLYPLIFYPFKTQYIVTLVLQLSGLFKLFLKCKIWNYCFCLTFNNNLTYSKQFIKKKIF